MILGAGISGLTAALYAARANLKPLVLAGHEEGGQLALTTGVENFPGFPEGVQGPELVRLAREQAARFGAVFAAEQATGFEAKSGQYRIHTGQRVIEAKAVIIATGASARMLGLESERKYLGRGVSTCATCDAYFFKEKEVLVVGGGDSACEESLFLTKFARKVTIVHRRDQMRASKIMQERVLGNRKIGMLWNTVVEEVLGDSSRVTGAKLRNVATGKSEEVRCDGVFLALGHLPNTGIFKGRIEMDENGFLKTDRRTRTNLPGVFASGDVQDPIYKQAITAAGSGCQAAMEAEKYLEGIARK